MVALVCTNCGYQGDVDYRDPPFDKTTEDFVCPECKKITYRAPANI